MVDKLLGKLESWIEAFVLMAPNLAGALAVLVGFWFIARLAGAATARVMGRMTDHSTLASLVYRTVRTAFVALGMVIALQILELDKAATTFLAGAGIVGLALGFAFQDLTANFIAGVAMALQRPLQIGDLVDSNGVFGTIEKIHLRSTYVVTLDGQRVIIPNRKVYQEVLTNFSALKTRRVDVEVGVSYGDDLERARDLAVEAVRGVERLEHREVELYYTAFGDSSINFVLRFWIAFQRQPQYLAARSSAVMAIKRAFDDGGITIPFPIRTLDFNAHGGERLREHLQAATPVQPKREQPRS